MDASSPPSDTARELDELRRRAYGPHPDIQGDPAALARLMELEAAHTANPPHGANTEIGEPAAVADGAAEADSVGKEPRVDRSDSTAGSTPEAASSDGLLRSLWHRLTALRARRGAIVAGVLVAVLTLAYAVTWLAGPHPDATLRPMSEEADGAVLSLMEFLGLDSDRSTIRGFEAYRGLEPWFTEDSEGFQCFMLVARGTRTVDGANCVPPGVDLFADIGAWPRLGDVNLDDLPDGSIVRFHYRGNSVDVDLYPASEPD